MHLTVVVSHTTGLSPSCPFPQFASSNLLHCCEVIDHMWRYRTFFAHVGGNMSSGLVLMLPLCKFMTSWCIADYLYRRGLHKGRARKASMGKLNSCLL